MMRFQYNNFIINLRSEDRERFIDDQSDGQGQG